VSFSSVCKHLYQYSKLLSVGKEVVDDLSAVEAVVLVHLFGIGFHAVHELSEVASYTRGHVYSRGAGLSQFATVSHRQLAWA